MFAVGGDLGSLARAISLETSEEVTGNNRLALSENGRPSVIQSEHEPLRLYYPDRPEADEEAIARAASVTAVDRPTDIGASGAFEPQIAEPEDAAPAPVPVAAVLDQEVLPVEESVSVEREAPRARCALPEAAIDGEGGQWVSGILVDEVRCREQKYGRKAEPRQADALPEPAFAAPVMPGADLALDGAAIDPGATRAERCEEAGAGDGNTASPWLGGMLAGRSGCDAPASAD
ncbi:MAG: hypothetical protein AAF371_04755 [Pseudomonadota bacterium]